MAQTKIRSRNALVTFKAENDPGTFTSPDPLTDAILVQEPELEINPQNTETNYVTGSLDGDGPIIGGIQATMSFSLFLKGAGAPGEAPEFGTLLRACGWAETVTRTELIAGASDISFAATGGTIDAGTSDLSAATEGTAIYVSGADNAANNGEYVVTSASASSLTVTKTDGSGPGLVDESAGASVTIVYGIAGQAAQSGATTSLKLGSSYDGTAGKYQGMPLFLSTNPSTPAFAFIADYAADKTATLVDKPFSNPLDGTTIASLPANVLYAPASEGIPAGSLEFYRGPVVYRLTGVRGTVTFTFTAGGAVQAEFEMQGLLHEKADAQSGTQPVPSYDGTRPGIWKNGLMLLARQAAAINQLSIEPSVEHTFVGNPNQPEGFDPPEPISRNMTGSMDPLETKVATRDVLTRLTNGEEQIAHARVLGASAQFPGQRLGGTIPRARYTSLSPGDRGGVASQSIPFFAAGPDAGAFLCFY